MSSDGGIYAELIYDGGSDINVPACMGKPREDQLQGTVAEKLTELAGRICYDSLGSGRNSAEYHTHIREVGHLSVCEHFNFTVQFIPTSAIDALLDILNRPGLFTRVERSGNSFILTPNLRTLLDWDKWSHLTCQGAGYLTSIESYLASLCSEIAPQIFGTQGYVTKETRDTAISLVEPQTDEEKWVSMYMRGSRGFSHEQIRHRFRTAVSQRSTRYCDESESPWIEHPLLPFVFDSIPETIREQLWDMVGITEESAKTLYDHLVYHGRAYLVGKGVDSLTARKQARGSARGFLGNALQTELIFSASVAQWRRMIEQRLTRHADAEIRELYVHVLSELLESRYADRFRDYRLKDSPDGIGSVLVE